MLQDAREEGPAGDAYVLTALQEGMLFHHLAEPGSGVDVEQILCTLHHPVDVARLQKAWDEVAARHPRLGVSVQWRGLPRPVQRDEVVRVPIRTHAFDGLPEAEREERLERFLEEDRHTPFQVDAPPLQRLNLFRFSDRDSVLVWTFPHIVMDGRSFAVVLRDVFALYDGEEMEGEGSGAAFRDFVSWVESRDASLDASFWRDYLSGLPETGGVPGSAHAAPPRGSGEHPASRSEVRGRLSPEVTRGLVEAASRWGVRLPDLLHGAWARVLASHTGSDDVVFGVVRAGRRHGPEGAHDAVGVLINTLPLRIRIDEDEAPETWLAEIRRTDRSLVPFEQTPLVRIQQWSELPQDRPLFESLVIYDHGDLDALVQGSDAGGAACHFELRECTAYPLTIYAYGGEQLDLRLAHDPERVDGAAAERVLEHLCHVLRLLAGDPPASVGDLAVLSPDERTLLLESWNRTERPTPLDATVHGLVLERLRADPGATVVACGDRSIRAEHLDRLSGDLCRHLQSLGVERGDLVGVSLPRSIDQVVALLGILRCGAAYVPLDPAYPAERLDFLVQDAELRAVMGTRETWSGIRRAGVTEVLLDRDKGAIVGAASRVGAREDPEVDPADRVYVLHTSGSTGQPKGVEVEHRNVVNLLAAMDEVLVPPPNSDTVSEAGPIGAPPQGSWLSLTSLSFDISALEIFWPLSRGQLLVLHDGGAGGSELPAEPFLLGTDAGAADGPSGFATPKGPDFSLFYFGADDASTGRERYRLLLEGARFADDEGFAAVWTPERHFHAFGGSFPNPSVTGAALAAVTRRIAIRAGSVVLPLHHPVRVAEEWAVVDNLSGGRAGISIASGWHPDDFLLAPENHAERKENMFRQAETLRRLWRGERVAFPGPGGGDVEVEILPRPVQPELPLWVTTAGSPDTYRRAGRMGGHVLTHLLGQSLSDLERGIRAYREARAASGHPPEEGVVTLMLHAFVGERDDEVREIVRDPMKRYLKSSVGLIRNFAAEWTAYRRTGDRPIEAAGDEFENLSTEDLDVLLDFAFERYFQTSGLFGSRERCIELVRRLAELGVNEIACLVDFGVGTDTVLAHLPGLADVRRTFARGDAAAVGPGAQRDQEERHSLARALRRHEVSCLQCTPSQLRLLLADPDTKQALEGLPVFLVGGEAFPSDLARELRGTTGGRVINVYGPTETTIWSTFHEVADENPGTDGVTPIGRPLANTVLYVLDPALRPVPIGVPGELFIGGRGVARGYLGRPALQVDRFLSDPFRSSGAFPGEPPRMYRTGDMVRYREGGVLEFLGRTDAQVKLRGHRVEPGEIEATIRRHPAVADCAVVLRTGPTGDARLVAYLVAAGGPGGSGALRAQVRGWLAERLPAIMIPSSFTQLERLPLTPNGKLDRKALPDPSAAPGVPERDVAAGSRPPSEADPQVVRRVASIWQDLLGRDHVGPDDNFFDLGGHSLLTVQVQSRVREEFGQEVRIVELFRHPTVRALAAHLGTASDDPAPKPTVVSAADRGARRREALRRRRTEQQDST
jgi:natural product biosynthesis luciferase-like monooxygenase protein